MKVIYESDPEEIFVEIQLSLKEIENITKFYIVSETSKSEEDFSKPVNVLIRRV